MTDLRLEQINSLTTEESEMLLFIVNELYPIPMIKLTKGIIPFLKRKDIIDRLDKAAEIVTNFEEQELEEYKDVKTVFDSMKQKIVEVY